MTTLTEVATCCDLCGEEVRRKNYRQFADGTPLEFAGPPNFVRINGGMRADLCDSCAEPIMEALRERIVVLEAEGRFKPPRFQND